MGPARQTDITKPTYPEPPKADYMDEVDDEALELIRAEALKDVGEIDEADLEVIAGPAW